MIRYYGIYASRTKGKAKRDGRFEMFGINKAENKTLDLLVTDEYTEVSDNSNKRSWARLIAKVYEVNPMICPKCSSEMKIIAVIHERSEIEKIIACMKKKNKPVLSEVERAPPDNQYFIFRNISTIII